MGDIALDALVETGARRDANNLERGGGLTDLLLSVSPFGSIGTMSDSWLRKK
jgi:hypothetical protein